MNLVSTRKTFHFEDESGYAFDVVAEETPGNGWTATVIMRASGYVTAEDAVRRLGHTAEQFLWQLRRDAEGT